MLEKSILAINGIGEKKAELFKKMGVGNIGALLCFYPRAYQDWSVKYRIFDAPLYEKVCLRAQVKSYAQEKRVRQGLTIYTVRVYDGSGELEVVLFNQKYAAASLVPGRTYLFYGVLEGNLVKREMKSPEISPEGAGGGLRPVYRKTAGLSNKYIEGAVKRALRLAGGEISDGIPVWIREHYGLCHIKFALENIHFPSDGYALRVAQKRLVFEELLYLSLGLLRLRHLNNSRTDAVAVHDYTAEFCRLLPFEPTKAQMRAAGQCAADMGSGFAMNRLLQGDVGSGKTMVAACAIYNIVKNGFQAAMIAPTEILAAQHYKTLTSFFNGCGISVELLTGSLTAAAKREVKSRIASGECRVVVGTHAVMQRDVSFDRLGLIVTDEQHRFGVGQRIAAAEKGLDPHILVMSATPIPRTLALTIYSDLEISILDELPSGRRPVETYVVHGSTHRLRAYRYMKQHLDRGLQGYIVCPLVRYADDGRAEQPELKAAEEYYDGLRRGEFSGYRVGLLHGKMKPAEKESVMLEFSSGKIQLLVSTVVIEVGVDVPNAVIMIIENADRFGLSQLHQLRGRVGRGTERSTCILITDSESGKSMERLKIIASTTDGFRIAEEDLRLRGPGDFFGYRQHGLPELKIADMIKDVEVMKNARECASAVLNDDPELEKSENAGLRSGVERLFEFSGGDMGRSI